jgi:hypothetical protein
VPMNLTGRDTRSDQRWDARPGLPDGWDVRLEHHL